MKILIGQIFRRNNTLGFRTVPSVAVVKRQSQPVLVALPVTFTTVWAKKFHTSSSGVKYPRITCARTQQHFFESHSHNTNHQLVTMLKLPEGMSHNWDFSSWTERDIHDRLPDVLNKMRELYDQAGTADMKNLTFESLLQPLLQVQRLTFGNFWWHGTMGAPLTFPKLVATSKEVRTAASNAAKEINGLTLDMFMREDIFTRLVEYKKLGLHEKENLDPVFVRFLDRMISDGKRNGLELEQVKQDKIKSLKTEISKLCQEFQQNVSEDNTTVLFDVTELAGVPADVIAEFPVDKDTGKKKLTMAYPDYLPVMKKCHVPATRQKMEFAKNNQARSQNEEILQKVVKLRQECANLLGYKNWSVYRLERLMSKNPETVDTFLESLAKKLQPFWENERKALLKLKEEVCKKYGYEFDEKLNMWDISYYLNMIEERDYSIDEELLKEYFPLETVTNGLIKVYSQILGLEFTKLNDLPKWHQDVFVYKVNDKESGELMGYVYMDLFPREGKHPHFCNKPIQSGTLNENGVKEKTVTCMICNFTPPYGDKPSLLTPDEVETYFHEFGHAMHVICSKAKAQVFWGTHVERDFVEAPSQMLENWVKQKEVLVLMSSHYKTGEVMPDAWIERLKKAQNANIGFHTLRQIVLSTFDQKIHRDGSLNPKQVYDETTKEILGLEATPNTFFPGHFQHLVNDYENAYYSYLWSQVFSVDMYETVFGKVGPLDYAAGKKYRETILEKGGSLDGFDLLRNFLGREPNQEAFLKSKGLD